MKTYKVAAPLTFVGFLAGTILGATLPRNCNKDEEVQPLKADTQTKVVIIKEPTMEKKEVPSTLLEQLGMAVVILSYDKNGDKKLSEGEVLDIFREKFDKDKDGNLSIEELIQAKRYLAKIVCD